MIESEKMSADEIDLLRKMVERGDVDELREMVRLWQGIKALGWLGTAIVKVAALVGSLYGVWYAVQVWLTSWRGP